MIRRSYKRQGGFTLLEVVVSSMLLAVVMLMAFSISVDCTKSAQEKISQMDLEVKGERTLKTLTSSLFECATIFIEPNYNQITYSVPLDTDNNGIVLHWNPTYVNSSGKLDPQLDILEFGAENEVGSKNDGYIRFSFYGERIFDEAVLNIDLNGDGDKNDRFEVGYIKRDSDIPGDVEKWMGVSNFVQRAGNNLRDGLNYGKSILNDNPTADDSGKIFSMAAGSRVIDLNLCLMDYTPSGIPHRVVSKGQVFLRNQVVVKK